MTEFDKDNSVDKGLFFLEKKKKVIIFCFCLTIFFLEESYNCGKIEPKTRVELR